MRYKGLTILEYDIIEITWIDITADNSWMPEKKVKTYKPTKCKTLGYFRNSDSSVVRTSYSINNDGDSGVEVIPKGVITDIKILKKSKKTKRKNHGG